MDSTYQNTTDQAVGEDKLPAPLEPGALRLLLIFIVITATSIGFFFGRHSVTDDYTSCDLGVMEDRSASANAEGCQYIDDLRSDAPPPPTITMVPIPMPTTPMITDEDVTKAEEALRQQVGYDSATLGQLPELRTKIVLATCGTDDKVTRRAASRLYNKLQIGVTSGKSDAFGDMRSEICAS